MLRRVVTTAVLAVCLVMARAGLADDAPTPKVWSDLTIRVAPLVTIENHGYFRFRFNELYRLDLGPGGRLNALTFWTAYGKSGAAPLLHA